MDWLNHKIPPPIIFVCCAALAWLLSDQLDNPIEIDSGQTLLPALVLVAIGFTIAFGALFEFRHANTTVDPHQPDKASALVVRGVYRFTRNPMYLGLLILLLAWVVYLAHPAALVVLPMLVLYLSRFQIQPEERILAEKFGESFAEYCARVRRWL